MIGRALASDKLTLIGSILLLLLLIAGLLGPLLTPSEQIGQGPRLGPPDADFLLGTDNLGRSLLGRVLEGIQMTFLLSSFAVLIAGLIGAAIALVSAHAGGIVDEVTARIADVLFSFPPILLGLLVTAVAGPGTLSAIAVVALVTLPTMIRVVRAAALGVSGRDFVLISRVIGASFGRRVAVHLLPNVVTVILVQFVYSISLGMLIESAISFLGLGVQPPDSSLGSLLRDGVLYLDLAPWLTFAPGICLAIAILSVNLVGDGLRRVGQPIEQRWI